MKLDEATYTVFDVETTGLFPYHGDKICEIGAVKVKPNGERETFERLVDPKRPISPGAFAVNQITYDMLSGKPAIDEVLPSFMEFVKDTVLVAYNAGTGEFVVSALSGSAGDGVGRDGDGRYEISGLPPGEYQKGENVLDVTEPETEQAKHHDKDRTSRTCRELLKALGALRLLGHYRQTEPSQEKAIWKAIDHTETVNGYPLYSSRESWLRAVKSAKEYIEWINLCAQ